MRVLVTEDDPHLASQLQRALEDAGHVVDVACDGAQAHFMGDVETYDIAILDLGLPVMDGLTVLHKWRESGHDMPVLILTARGNWDEKVTGMDAGADDYLTKPFHMQELLARVRALVRRNSQHSTAQWTCGEIILDTRSTRVLVSGQSLGLTSHEYRVLAVLMRRAGEVVSRTELAEHVYPQDLDRDSNTIDVFVGRLRKKLPPNSIETIRGLGYRLVPGPSHATTQSRMS
ncbi:response regulator transcription factor [Orrella marina]|uniref:DNA-binding response regulator n=1 Tax=Orrella marina TaxID=2163011 RepID=A0A2R4XF26_9BURK|nr:response regulator transcription factor [Orrella marina]AWB32407.1 DNA-binding response regulator [Orrella marina]